MKKGIFSHIESVSSGESLIVDVSPKGLKKAKSKYSKVLFSSSASGKFRILKNGSVLGTLFTGSFNKNAHYLFDVDVLKKDKVAVEFINQDMCAADFYVSFEVK